MNTLVAVVSLASIIGCLFGIPVWAAQSQASTLGAKIVAGIIAILAVLAWLAIMVSLF